MIFKNKYSPNAIIDINILMDNNQLSQVKTTKFLGVLIDENLSWKTHTTHVRSIISKYNDIIRKVRQFLPSDSLPTLFNTLVYPYISIMVQLYGLTTTIPIVTQFCLYRKELLERAQTPCGLNIQIPFSSPWIHLKFRTYILFKLVFSCINSTIIYFLMTYLSQIISPWTMKFTITILVVPRTFV